MSGSPDAFAEVGPPVLVRRETSACGLEQAQVPTAISAALRSELLQPDTGYPYPGVDPAPWQMTPPDFGPGAVGFPTGMPVTDGAGASMMGDAVQPDPLDGLLLAMVAVLFVGVVAGVAIHALKRRTEAGSHGAEESAADGGVDVDGPMADSADSSASVVAMLRGYAWPALLILAVAVGPVLCLTVLLQGLAFPESSFGVRLGTQVMLYGLAPYLLVFSCGALIGAAEVIATFPAFSGEALSTRWAMLLILVNAFAIAIVFSTVMSYSASVDHPLFRAFAVAAGFAVLMRSRLVLARDLRGRAGGEGVGLDFGWLYGRCQMLCYQRIDRDLLQRPYYATERLLELFPEYAALERVANYAIETRDPSEAAELRARLDAIRSDDLGPSILRARIARFIVQTAGLDHARFLIEHADLPSFAPAPETPPR